VLARLKKRWRISDQWDAPLDPNFTGMGRVVTGYDGSYCFVTVRPGAYPWGNHDNAWRPSHIHLSLVGPAFATRLVTQLYFPDVGGTCADIAKTLKATDWRRLASGAGTKGPRWHDWCYLELADFDAAEFSTAGEGGTWTRGLLIRRRAADGELAFSTWCPAGTPITTLAKVQGHRWAIDTRLVPGVEPMGAIDAEHVALARAPQRLLDLADAVDAVGRHPAERRRGGDGACDHARGQVRLGREADVLRHGGLPQTSYIVGPALRQIQSAVDEGVAAPRDIGGEDADRSRAPHRCRQDARSRHPRTKSRSASAFQRLRSSKAC
jgi:hypothetical protein